MKGPSRNPGKPSYVLDQANMYLKLNAMPPVYWKSSAKIQNYIVIHNKTDPVMFSDASIDHYEHAKGEHVIDSRLGTTLCRSFDNPAGEDIIHISCCLFCEEKKHRVAANGLESLLLRADRYSRNLNCEIDHNVCRTVTSTRNSIIYQGILRLSGTRVAIKSIIWCRPDSDTVKVNSFYDFLSHWPTNYRLANSS